MFFSPVQESYIVVRAESVEIRKRTGKIKIGV